MYNYKRKYNFYRFEFAIIVPGFKCDEFNIVAPRWVKEPADINVTRGDGGQLACSGFSIPKPKITWLKSTGWYTKLSLFPKLRTLC